MPDVTAYVDDRQESCEKSVLAWLKQEVSEDAYNSGS